MSGQLSWLEAGVVGAMQGVTELFPVSSLGHSVLLPAWVGGSWARDLDVSSPESPYLAFIVGLHVATALALIVYFWRDWVRIVKGLATSIARREVRTSDQRLAWLLVLATIPVGLVGLIGEHWFRVHLGRPTPTAVFLMVNGLILLFAERMRRRADEASATRARLAQLRSGPAAEVRPGAAPGDAADGGPDPGTARASTYQDERVSGPASDARLSLLPVAHAVLIGALQIAALAPGISRSGIAMVGGLSRGLSREDAAHFAFLLATPVILAAGVLKLGDLAGPLGAGIRGQVLFGSLLSGVGAYLSVRYLTRYLADRSLRPFGIYCLVAGAASLVLFAVR